MTAATLFTILIVAFILSFLIFVFVAQRVVSRRAQANFGSSSVGDGGAGTSSSGFGDSRSDCGYDSGSSGGGSGDCSGDGGGGGD